MADPEPHAAHPSSRGYVQSRPSPCRRCCPSARRQSGCRCRSGSHIAPPPATPFGRRATDVAALMVSAAHREGPGVVGELPRATVTFARLRGFAPERLAPEEDSGDGEHRRDREAHPVHQSSPYPVRQPSWRSATSSSAIRRSSGVVTLRFSGERRVEQDPAARLLHQHRVVGGGGDPLAARCPGPREGRRAEDLRGLHSPQLVAIHGLGHLVGIAGGGSAERLTVSVIGAAAITAAASGRSRSFATSSSISSGVTQRPGGVVHRDELGLDSLAGRPRPTRSGSRRRRPPRPHRGRDPRIRPGTATITAPTLSRSREGVERPVEERTPPKLLRRPSGRRLRASRRSRRPQ